MGSVIDPLKFSEFGGDIWGAAITAVEKMDAALSLLSKMPNDARSEIDA
jgi:hypothetical protein